LQKIVFILEYFMQRQLKALKKSLYEELMHLDPDAELDEAVPTNDQTYLIPFNFAIEIPEDKITIKRRLLGSGAYGTVLEGELCLSAQEKIPVACKKPASKLIIIGL
jgi:hypothetical protein